MAIVGFQFLCKLAHLDTILSACPTYRIRNQSLLLYSRVSKPQNPDPNTPNPPVPTGIPTLHDENLVATPQSAHRGNLPTDGSHSGTQAVIGIDQSRQPVCETLSTEKGLNFPHKTVTRTSTELVTSNESRKIHAVMPLACVGVRSWSGSYL